MSTVSLDSDALRPIVAKAILEEIGPEARDLLIQNALDNLMKPSVVRGQYGREEEGPSMIEEIVRDKVRELARKIVEELLGTPEYAEQARTAITDGLIKALQDEDNGWLLNSIGYATGEVVTKMLREKS